MGLTADIVKGTLKGKTLGRIMLYRELSRIEFPGRILDLGAGKEAGYYQLQAFGGRKILNVDISENNKPVIVADLNQDLPLQENAFDQVLMFNLLEHLYNYQDALGEAFRVLKPGGRITGSVPFLVRFHPNPDDFYRFTSSALTRNLERAGFEEIEIKCLGFGPCAASYSQVPFLFPRFLRIFFIFPALIIDSLILKLKPFLGNKFPLAYFFSCRKPAQQTGREDSHA